MMINTDNLVSITDANQNFSRVARMVDENGAAIILKNNVPRYILMEFNQLKKNRLLEMKIFRTFQSALWQRISMHMRYWQNEKAEQ